MSAVVTPLPIAIEREGSVVVVSHNTSLEEWTSSIEMRTAARSQQALEQEIVQTLVASGWAPSSAENLVYDRNLVSELAARNAKNFGNPHAIGEVVNDFLVRSFAGAGLEEGSLKVPGRGESLVITSPRMAEELSVPKDGFEYHAGTVHAYRGGTKEDPQGVGYQPENHVRTTEGSFHITAGVGDPAPFDKVETPKDVSARLIQAAYNPPENLQRLPYTVDSGNELKTSVSMMYKVYVEPPEVENRKFVLVHFEAPGEWVGNLHFVGDIFPFGGDPFDPNNDPRLDANWCGHIGHIVLAPHLRQMSAKDLGLPHKNTLQEGDRRLRDGMFYERDSDVYNKGNPFVLHTRDADVTHVVITDNYYGYCKKMVKTILDHATKRLGDSMEEHSGTIKYRQVTNVGMEYHSQVPDGELGFGDQAKLFESLIAADQVVMFNEDSDSGIVYAVDRNLPCVYLPQNVSFFKNSQEVHIHGERETLKLYLDPQLTYMLPNGDQVRLQKDPLMDEYKLVVVSADSVVLHKPFTVSGGGKSELAKELRDMMNQGFLTVSNFEEELEFVKSIVNGDVPIPYADRFKVGAEPDDGALGRLPLDSRRSLASLRNLLTPDDDRYTPEYNAWLRDNVSPQIKQWVYTLKMLWTEEMGDSWPEYFGVDVRGETGSGRLKFGYPGYEKLDVSLRYLRVGNDEHGQPQWFPVAPSFEPGMKWQTGDDISVSIVLGSHEVDNLSNALSSRHSVSFTSNAEESGFQRPDGATEPGAEHLTEEHYGELRLFKCNMEPLDRSTVKAILRCSQIVERFHPSLRERMERFATASDAEGKYFFLPDHWRVLRDAKGEPLLDKNGEIRLTSNPRYLMPFPKEADSVEAQLASRALHLHRNVPFERPVYEGVEVVIPANRFDKEDKEHNFPPLAVNGAVHAVDLPELLAQIAASLTVKSRSTSGPGSEGAGTKRPFMELSGIYELNNVLLQLGLTEQEVFVTASGRVGPKYLVDHDLSFLAAEVFGVWSRVVSPERRSFANLKATGYIRQEEPFYYDPETKAKCEEG
ncbi:MAG: hypothetical protein KDD60_03805, partial [Bdellovibrionales bacterium]|nr:hypothetical protein [Bdellovibrionales bacterium]